MRSLTFAFLLAFLSTPLALRADDWPPQELRGAWLVTYASSDGEEEERSKGNILVFHNDQMVFAFDRNYGPPSSELGAIGYEFYAIKTSNSKSFGLARVQRGKLKFMLEHNREAGRETITVKIEDYANNRVKEIVQFRAERMDTMKARDRIRWLLGSPKYETDDARTHSVETLEAWLKTEVGEPSVERKLPTSSDAIENQTRGWVTAVVELNRFTLSFLATLSGLLLRISCD